MAHAPSHEQLCKRVCELETQLAMHANPSAYKEIVENLPVFICRFLLDTTTTLVNSAYCDYFGKDKKDLIVHAETVESVDFAQRVTSIH